MTKNRPATLTLCTVRRKRPPTPIFILLPYTAFFIEPSLRMTRPLPSIERFIHSHHLFGGTRQAVGVLVPPFILGGITGEYQSGMTAAVGAACVAILDQPGGPRRYGIQGMAAAVLLGSLTVAITGVAGTDTLLTWLVVPLLCFGFSMFTVFGQQGGLLGFACLLIMTLTLRSRPELNDVWIHTAYSLGGGLFY